MTTVALLAAPAVVAGAGHIWARMTGRARLALWLKPIPIVLFVVMIATDVKSGPSLYAALILLGLLASLAGDILLAWPSDRFLAGLLLFLLAHLTYTTAFVMRAGFAVTPWVATLVALWGALMLALLWPHVERSMRAPVVLYMLVILTMAGQAIEAWLTLGGLGSALAMIGALFFVASDSALALDKFRRSFVAAPIVVMVTYYLAQWLIALSAI